MNMATVRVDLLDGGSLSTADISMLHANTNSRAFRMYDWCFHIYHSTSNRHILWDVGISSDRSLYTPLVLDTQWSLANPVGPKKPLVKQLEALNVQGEQIDTVFFSHAHWDHCRPIRDEFPMAKGLLGPGTKRHCSPGHIVDGEPTSESLWDGRFFGPSEYVSEDWAELEGSFEAFAPFPRALDYFGDGSFMILDAPGHMIGNLAAAARIDVGESKAWVILSSDCCHSRQLLSGEAEIGYFDIPGGKACLHEDIHAAKDTISRLRKAETQEGMHVAMAHDVDWICEGTNPVLMSLLSMHDKEDFLRAVRAGAAP